MKRKTLLSILALILILSATTLAMAADTCSVQPSAPKIDTRNNGTYTSGSWTYKFTISGKGTKSEGYYGDLSFEGEPLPNSKQPDSRVCTPWGFMYLTDSPMQWGSHGWMLHGGGTASNPTQTLAALAAEQNVAGSAEVVDANSQFALALYQNINADNNSKGQNIFVSPYSISTALAMTYAGSRGNTQKQMASVLGFTNIPEGRLHAGFSSLLGRTKASPEKHYKLDVANALWGQKDYHFEPAFISTINKYYDGGFNVVDYIGAREESRNKINRWVETKTADKIRNLVHSDDLDMDTRLVLTNAIYFKGDWASKFNREKTFTAPFTIAPGRTIDVAMMEQMGSFSLRDGDGVKMIEIPYAGNDVSMIVIVPEGDIEKFGGELSLAKLRELRKQMRPHQVELFLPRFKFETRYYLEENLSDMGMPDAFSELKADFSGMDGARDLRISHVIHQAMIDVNEEGGEASAATAVVVTWKSMPEVFRADRPFLFLIMHKPTDSILFMGRVSSPPRSATAPGK